jgi:hypothetical protein
MAASSTDAVQAYVEKEWDATIVPALTEYIKVRSNVLVQRLDLALC